MADFDETTPLAIIAGSGDLPRLIAEDRQRRGLRYQVIGLVGQEPGAWVQTHPYAAFPPEKMGGILKLLKSRECGLASFAGGMTRPTLSPLKFDFKMVRLAPRILKAMKAGDDTTLRVFTDIFEREGMKVVAPHDLMESLLMPEGVLTKLEPSEEDKTDAARAAEIVAAIGEVDVGQGAVVAQGICLAVESIQGTDAMLDFVAQTADRFRHDPDGSKGVLLKAPKPGQDWRVDLPAIGPDTITNAAKAGLSGVVVQSGAVLVLGLEETIAAAEEAGLFLWGRPVS